MVFGFALTRLRAWGEGQTWGLGRATLLPENPANHAKGQVRKGTGTWRSHLGSYHVELQDALVGLDLYLKTPIRSSSEPGPKSGGKSAKG